ncbi:MAG: Holliday junction resolvase RuvX [bacterium]
MPEQRILAIDYGEKRIGLAISIPGFKMVEPLKTLESKKLWEGLEEVFQQYDIKTVVVGLPLRTDGKDDKTTTKAREFAKAIQLKFNINVELWDERYSTVDVENILKDLGKHPSKEKGNIDKYAATLILEEYLASLP